MSSSRYTAPPANAPRAKPRQAPIRNRLAQQAGETVMLTPVHALIYSGILTFIILLLATAFCAKMWTPEGAMIAFGNREDPPTRLGFAGRADRAANNQIEAMVVFLALVLAAQIAGRGPQVAFGATVFFWARLIYWPVYLAGIVYLRTLIWFVGVFGLILILKELL